MARFRCTVCNWIYDEEAEGVPFADLPESWSCPRCGAPKSAFVPEGVTKEEGDVDTNVADAIVRQLVAFGVEEIYGIPGDSNLPLVDAIRRDGRIRFILVRHEETAAFMATATAKVTGKLGVCMSIAGPGTTNLVTGLMDASADRAPVLALLGQVPEVYLGSEAFQEIDQLELFQPFTQSAETVARANQAVKLTVMAVKHAYKGPGVSTLSTPTDVLVEKLDQRIAQPERKLFRCIPPPCANAVERAADVIDAHGDVAIVAGWGTRNAAGPLMELAGRLEAPVATTSRAKGIIDEYDEYSLGVLGSIGSMRAAKAVQGCDLLIVAGTGFRHANLVPPDTTIVQIDQDPTRIGRTFDVSAGIVGDADAALEMLADRVAAKERNERKWDRMLELRREHMELLAADAKDRTRPISPGYVISALRRTVPENALITVDVGDHTYWFFKRFLCRGQRVFLSANIASMGFGLPAALAAQLAHPDRPVLCFTGDGGFAMLMADFTTAVREELPITVVVMNDGKLKNIKKEQARDGYPEFGVTFPNPDFAAFAESAGGKGVRVEDPAELDSALETAIASSLPALVDVVIDPEKMIAATKRVE